MKKCIDKDCQHGPQPLTAFTHRDRYLKDGTRSHYISGRCKECFNRRARARKKGNYIYSEGKCGVQTPHKHEGPQGAERAFFCK